MKTAFNLLLSILVASPLLAQTDFTVSFPVSSDSEQAVEKFKEGSKKLLDLQYIDSESLLDEAITHDPAFAVALATKAWTTYSKDTLEARRLISRANHQYASLSFDEQNYIEGINALIHKREALSYFEILVERHPNCEFLSSFLAKLYFQQGQRDKMVQTLNGILASNKEAAWAYNMLGYYYLDQKEYPEARKAFEQYMLLAPLLANPYDSMGDFYMAQGQFEKAKANYEQAFMRDPINFQFSQAKALEADQATAANH